MHYVTAPPDEDAGGDNGSGAGGVREKISGMSIRPLNVTAPPDEDAGGDNGSGTGGVREKISGMSIRRLSNERLPQAPRVSCPLG